MSTPTLGAATVPSQVPKHGIRQGLTKHESLTYQGRACLPAANTSATSMSETNKPDMPFEFFGHCFTEPAIGRTPVDTLDQQTPDGH
jgi:hypothetical protein